MKKRSAFTVLLISIILTITLNPGTLAAPGWPEQATNAGTTTRVSVASDGTQGNGWSREPAISADGRYVAFASDATFPHKPRWKS